jgi:hypothetical protein
MVDKSFFDLAALSSDIFSVILSYLSLREVFHLMIISKTWNSYVRTSHRFVRCVYRSKSKSLQWKSRYIEICQDLQLGPQTEEFLHRINSFDGDTCLNLIRTGLDMKQLAKSLTNLVFNYKWDEESKHSRITVLDDMITARTTYEMWGSCRTNISNANYSVYFMELQCKPA